MSNDNINIIAPLDFGPILPDYLSGDIANLLGTSDDEWLATADLRDALDNACAGYGGDQVIIAIASILAAQSKFNNERPDVRLKYLVALTRAFSCPNEADDAP